jgi:hypothetical protein
MQPCTLRLEVISPRKREEEETEMLMKTPSKLQRESQI